MHLGVNEQGVFYVSVALLPTGSLIYPIFYLAYGLEYELPETFFFTLQMRTRWFWLAKSSCFLSSTAFCHVLKVMWKMVCVNSFQVGPGFGEQGCISPWRFPRTALLLHLRESPPPMHSHFSKNLFPVFLPGVTIVIMLRLSHF